MEKYMYTHNLKWYDVVPPINYPVAEVTTDPINPFNINYSWLKKHKNINHLPNHFVF